MQRHKDFPESHQMPYQNRQPLCRQEQDMEWLQEPPPLSPVFQ